MHSKKYIALFFVICMMASDFMIPVVLAGHHGNRGGHGLELLLAAGILAKLLRKKGHHHHGHHHHHHGHGRHASDHHQHPHEAGAQTVEVVHVAPPLGGYSSHYPTSAQSSYGGAQAATSFSSSIEYPFSPAASHHMPIQHIPYGGPPSAASYLGYEPQPVQMYPPIPLSLTDSGPMHA